MPLPVAVLHNLAASSRNPRTSALALAALSGDQVAHMALSDHLIEEELDMTGLEVGKNYYVETVTKYWTGTLVHVDHSGLRLVDAAWIPNTGRFHEAMSTGRFAEVEPLPNGVVQLIPAGVITGISEWSHPLPRKAVP